MIYPFLEPYQQAEEMTQAFFGINRNEKARDGEWYEEANISGRKFPCFAPRAERGVVRTIPDAAALGGNHEGLAWTSGSDLYYKGEKVDGITLDPALRDKRIVTFGAYLIVVPDFVYYNTANPADKGTMAVSYSKTGGISYAMSRDDGTDYDTANIPVQIEPPKDPANGSYWIDTSGDKHLLMQYSEYSAAWVNIPTVYTKISATGIGAQFQKHDSVEISGAAYTGPNEELQRQIEALNGSKLIYTAGQDYILVVGLLDSVYTQTEGTLKVERRIPRMSHVCVSQNRLWGCWYGEVDGKTVNEIYASALGDFKNFYRFAGISTDSYAVSVGQDGVFTGATNHLGYPIFFKENVLYKVHGNQPRNYQVNDTVCAGVREGCDRSVQIVNHTLYYISRDGQVVSYDGALPQSVSDSLKDYSFSSGSAGAYENMYYLSAKDRTGRRHLLTLDTANMVWHREDDLHVIEFKHHKSELYAMAGDELIAMTGKAGTIEEPFDWSAATGLIGWMQSKQKYISRFNIRAELQPGASIKLEIEYNSSGKWEPQGGKTADDKRVGTVMLPVRPKRCDHFRLRISGHGQVMVYSISKQLETGGDGRGWI